MANLEPSEHSLASAPALAGKFGIDLLKLKSRPYYELSKDSFIIHDPVWGQEEIGDQKYDKILIELAHSDPLRRLQTIEQLTLPERYATIEGSAHFSRWEHAWGSTILVRRLAESLNLEPKEAMRLQLKILLSDIKHTSFSHAGDWMFQGEGGGENEHDKNRSDYTEVVGINRLLELHGFNPDSIFEDDTKDFTNTPQPLLDADRVDYTLREGYRWVDQSPLYKQHLNRNSFNVVEGQLVANNIDAARLMASTYLLLVKEHWQHPVHRLQLNLLLNSLKRVFVARNGKTNEWGSYSPRDLMTTADHTFMEKFREHDEYMHIVDRIMVDLARSERKSQWYHRRNLARYVIEKTLGGKPQKVEWITDYYDSLPSICEIEPVGEGHRLQDNSRMKVIPLDALRLRCIDPLFIDSDGELRQISEADPKLWDYIQRNLAETRLDYRAGIVQNRDRTATIKDFFKTNDEQWPIVMQRPRLPSGAVAGLLRKTVKTSPVEASRFIGMDVSS